MSGSCCWRAHRAHLLRHGLEMKVVWHYFTSGGDWTWGGSEVVAAQTRYWEDSEGFSGRHAIDLGSCLKFLRLAPLSCGMVTYRRIKFSESGRIHSLASKQSQFFMRPGSHGPPGLYLHSTDGSIICGWGALTLTWPYHTSTLNQSQSYPNSPHFGLRVICSCITALNLDLACSESG